MVKKAKSKTAKPNSKSKSGAGRVKAARSVGPAKTKSVRTKPPAKPGKAATPLQRSLVELRDFALSYPETVEDFPWGHTTVKVRGKIFLFLEERDDALTWALKLPYSGEEALRLPFTRSTPYGMGKHGWVSAAMQPGDLPVETMRNWIDESFRAVAPKAVAAKAPAPPPQKE